MKLLTLFVCFATISCIRVRKVIVKIGEDSIEIIHNQHKEKDVLLDKLHSQARHAKEGRNFEVWYHNGDGEEKFAHATHDPRLQFGDWYSEERQDMHGGHHTEEFGYVALTLPMDASFLSMRRPHGKANLQVHIPHHEFLHEKFTKTAAAPFEAPFPMTSPVGPPSQTKNLVFLPCGYTEAQKGLFYSTVMRAQWALSGELRANAGLLQSAPWDRYWPLLNVYTVWEASDEEGASYPKSADGSEGGKPPNNQEITRSNNLDCAYGSKIVRLLNCDFAKALALASHTQSDSEKQLVIVLVNDETYGGSGGNGMATIFAGNWEACTPLTGFSANKRSECVPDDGQSSTTGWRMVDGNKFLRVLVHELGHADANLLDEYSYEIEEKQQYNHPNCYWSGGASEVPWSHWLQPQMLEYGPYVEPVQVCGYTNYFKPMQQRCLMESEAVNEFGPACAEGVATALYRDLSHFVSYPCPKLAETMIVYNTDEEYTIAMSSKFFSSGFFSEQTFLLPGAHPAGTFPANHPRSNGEVLPLRQDLGNIKISWAVNGKSRGQTTSKDTNNAQTVITITGNEFAEFNQPYGTVHEVTATIEDLSAYVHPSHPIRADNSHQKTFTWRVEVRDKALAANGYNLCNQAALDPSVRTEKDLANDINECQLGTTTAGIDQYYCAVCDVGAICNDTYPIRPVEAQANIEGVVQKLEDMIFGIGGAIAAVAFFGFIGLWLLLSRYLANEAGDIAEYPKIVELMRYAMLGTSVIMMLVSVFVSAYAIYSYSEVEVFFKVVILLLVIGAALLFLVAFIGFTAAFYRSRTLLVVNGILLTIVVGFFTCMGIAVLYFGNNIEAPEYLEYLTEKWNEQIVENPKSMCTFQATAGCSGFTSSCHNKMHAQCPQNCDLTNADNPDPCYDYAVFQVQKYFRPAGIAAVVTGCCMLLGWINNWVLCACIRERKKAMKNRLNKDGSKPANPNSPDYAISIMRNLKDSERDKLKEQFRLYDKKRGNGDGKLTAPQLKDFLRRTVHVDVTSDQSKRCIEKLAPTGKNTIKAEEYIDLFRKSKTMVAAEPMVDQKDQALLSDARVQHLDPQAVQSLLVDFRRIDLNKNDYISVQELSKFYESLYHQAPDPEALNGALRKVDNDGSGSVQFHEFCLMFCGAS